MKNKILIALLCLSTLTFAQNDPQSYLIVRALEIVQSGNYDQALEFLVKEIQNNPANGYAYAYVSLICDIAGYKSPQLEYANKALLLLPKKDPMRSEMYKGLGKLYLNLQDTTKAMQYFDDAIKADPTGNATAYTLRGAILRKQHNYDMAVKEALLCIKKCPKSIQGYLLAAEAYQAIDNIAEAMKYANQGIKKAGDKEKLTRAELYILRSQQYQTQKDYPSAITDAMTTARIGHINDGLNQLEKIAKDSAATAIVIDSLSKAEQADNNFIWLLALADICHTQNQYIHQVYWLYKAAERSDMTYIKNELAQVLTHYLNLPDEAEQLYKEALAKDSANSSTYAYIADLYHDLGRYDEALTYANKAVSLSKGDNTRSFDIRMRIYREKHEYDNAIQDLYRVLALYPKGVDTWFSIGDMHKRQGDTIAAQKAYEEGKKAIERTGAKYTDAAYISLEEYDKAQKTIVIKNDKSPSQHYNAACIYAQAGNTDKALEEFKKSLELGFRNFNHIVWDSDLDNIRQMPEFLSLIEEYKAKTLSDQKQLKRLLNIQ